MCGAARSCRLASNCTCASRTPDPILGSWGVLLQMSKNIKDKSFFEPVPLCLPMFMRAMFLQRSLVTPFVGNCLTNPGPDLTTLSSSVCGWSESLELLQTFRHRTLTSNVPWTSFQAKACASSGTQWCGAFLSLLSTDTIRGSLHPIVVKTLETWGCHLALVFCGRWTGLPAVLFSTSPKQSASGAMGPHGTPKPDQLMRPEAYTYGALMNSLAQSAMWEMGTKLLRRPVNPEPSGQLPYQPLAQAHSQHSEPHYIEFVGNSSIVLHVLYLWRFSLVWDAQHFPHKLEIKTKEHTSCVSTP